MSDNSISTGAGANKPGGHFISIGHSAWDRTYRVKDLPAPPSKVRALEHVESGGGTAANAAAAIGRLGGKVELWSRFGGGDLGQYVIADLNAYGVDTQFVIQHERSRTSTAVVIVDARGERLVVSERDHAMPADAGWLPLDRISSTSVVLSDLTWREASLAAFEKARDAGAVTLVDLDIAGGLPAEEILRLTDYAIASKGALAEFFPAATIEDQLEALLKKGPRYAGVTLGEAGYRWADQSGGKGRKAAFQVDVVDTTGAGDTFHGAFGFAIASGAKNEDAARFAAATAALKCRRLGARAGLPRLEEVAELLAKGNNDAASAGPE